MKKIYQVIIQDEYDDLYHIGFYKTLKDSLPDVNEFLFNCYDITIDELKEYPSTWEYVFDTEVEVDNGEAVVTIRGFIFDEDHLKSAIESSDENEG